MERLPPGDLKGSANRWCASVSSFSRRVSSSTRSEISAPTISRSPGQLETSRDSASARDRAFAAARTLREWEKSRRSACNFPPALGGPPGPGASAAGPFPPAIAGAGPGPACAPVPSEAPACRGFRPGKAVPSAAVSSWIPGAAWRPPAFCGCCPASTGSRAAADAGLPPGAPAALAAPGPPAAVGCVSASFARLPTVVRWFLFFPMAVPPLPQAAQLQVGPPSARSAGKLRQDPSVSAQAQRQAKRTQRLPQDSLPPPRRTPHRYYDFGAVGALCMPRGP